MYVWSVCVVMFECVVFGGGDYCGGGGVCMWCPWWMCVCDLSVCRCGI